MNARHRTVRALGMAAGAVLATLLAAGVAVAQPADPPQLSISVEGGRAAVEVGDTLDYTVTVRNLGTAAVKALRVTQTVPAGVTFESADPSARTAADGVTWQVTLRPNGETTVRSTMTVERTPPDLLRIATVACARVAADDPPIVCASHTARLPAADTATASAPATDDGLSASQIAVGAGLLAAVAALVVLLILHRRRRSGAKGPDTADDDRAAGPAKPPARH